ncbi:hydantoinase/carbamoylase family amidase [Breznakiella homolactica]|uniref:Hydantoinase/carbamoylase family amidase n=1 Tax=Breznakiella homolactica TaxID=2798577 RepID=A0A7T8BCS5_9SPIR|nr:hydantoinase/carbamoylase family amidase [Breznakiella homolactica]QQO10563.1 hydantoinase/carbamoylase family amidase [Breznakiella homolactica]
MVYSVEDIRYIESAFNRFYDIGTADAGGVTRLGYTEAEDAMHGVFSALGQEMGLDVSTDQAGNTFLSNCRESEEYYLIGSHLDSVVEGGRYDGVAGILAGLLVMRWAKQKGMNIPIRTAAFRCEESSNFGVSTIGSSLVTGGRAGKELFSLTGRDGRTLGEIFAERGYSPMPDKITGVKQYLELHIEQGRVLQEYSQRIGIVSTIAGPRRFNLYIQGLAEHSGATPMVMRRDALCAAAELILEIEKIGLAESVRNSVATVAVVNNIPNVLNVIPGEVRLQVDTRGIETASLDEIENRIKQAGKSISRRRGTSFIKERISDTKPVAMDQGIQDKLAKVVHGLGISHRRMVSGAGHDAMQFAEICDTALLFIPCRDGVSHNKNEFTNMDSICEGAMVLYTYLAEEFKNT